PSDAFNRAVSAGIAGTVSPNGDPSDAFNRAVSAGIAGTVSPNGDPSDAFNRAVSIGSPTVVPTRYAGISSGASHPTFAASEIGEPPSIR
ncbi:hypothetical protein, partial [Kitasatospora griseola]|uniref:hypothetical protein n=1 Tax=Kitasatospora griseola TaxID=2064 RepID=UPI0034494589